MQRAPRERRGTQGRSQLSTMRYWHPYQRRRRELSKLHWPSPGSRKRNKKSAYFHVRGSHISHSGFTSKPKPTILDKPGAFFQLTIWIISRRTALLTLQRPTSVLCTFHFCLNVNREIRLATQSRTSLQSQSAQT